jgi:hypothetical protein
MKAKSSRASLHQANQKSRHLGPWGGCAASSDAPVRSLWWQHLIRTRARLAPVYQFSAQRTEAAMHDVTELHEALARVVVADRELSEVLTEITGIARRAMPDTEAASVTLIRGEKPFTAAYDGQMALDADELQSHTGTDPVWKPAGPAKCSCRGHAERSALA